MVDCLALFLSPPTHPTKPPCFLTCSSKDYILLSINFTLQVRPFCSSRCYADYKLRMRLCTFCQRDLSTASDSFSAPVGSEGSFKDFCSQPCMKKYEDLLSTDVEIIRVEPGKPRGVNKCSVCQKVRVHCWSVLITFWGLAGSELACQVCCWSP